MTPTTHATVGKDSKEMAQLPTSLPPVSTSPSRVVRRSMTSAYVSRPRLSHDILLYLFEHMQDQADMVLLMGTCRTLRRAGVTHLLARGVVVRTPSALRSFCTFMLSDIVTRAPLLRQLSIKIPDELFGPYTYYEGGIFANHVESEQEHGAELNSGHGRDSLLTWDLADMLARVLQKTENIEDLSVYACANLLCLNKDMSISSALIHFKHLRRVRMERIWGPAAEFLEGACSSLVELDLDGSSSDTYADNVLAVLEIHFETLEKLILLCGELKEVEYLPGMGIYVEFPKLRALALRNYQGVGSAIVTMLSKSFPALRHFELFDNWELDPKQTRADAPPDVFPWGVLDRVCGDVDSLYGLGGTLCAKILEVYRVNRSDAGQFEWLHAVISDIKPTHLVLHIGLDPGFSAIDISNLLPLGYTNVTHLVLNLTIASFMEGSAYEFLFALAALLHAHPVPFVILRFIEREVLVWERTYIDDSNPEDEDERPPPRQTEIVEGMKTARFEETVLPYLFKASPALTHVGLEIEGHSCAHWTLQGGDDGLVTELLNEATGRAVVHAAGLGLRDGLIECLWSGS
ncbi:hypothetical protein C2E23DRAFT_895898 [Lenzites betulinus]|nr:hypothetical protein C2E23DRAFT_895898 [Lenzites betulinus]